jgi:hypothetical protein
MRKAITFAAIAVGVCALLVVAQFALIEIGHEVVVVHEPTPDGGVRRARLWVVDQGSRSWIHPGNANAQWWVKHMDAHPVVEVERGGQVHRYRAAPDPAADAEVHRLMRAKYGFADWWVRFLTGTDTRKGLITGQTCTTVPIRLDPVAPAS